LPKDLFLRCDAATKDKYLSFPGLEREYQRTLAGDMEYCVVDLETTGFDPARDGIIEVAALRAVGGEIEGRLSSLIDPRQHIPSHIRLLTGIDDGMVSGAPTIDEFFDELQEFLGDTVVVAYSRFEEDFLNELYGRLGGRRFTNPYLDVMDLAVILMPSLAGHRQSELASAWGIEAGDEHRAPDDAATLFEVFNILLNGLYDLPLGIIKALVDHSPTHGGGLSVLLARVLEERSGGRQVETLKLDRAARRDRSWEGIPPLEGTSTPPVVRPEEVRGVFSVGGPLADQFCDYEERDEQLQMAEAVRRAFEQQELVMVEAGTGTGKSLAYLVPGVLWSRRTELPMVVSTRTLNLQDQLFTKDLPTLEGAMGPGSFRFSVLKGYGNYICLRKLQGLINSRKRLGEHQLGALGMLLTWITESDSGDISLLNVSHLRGLGEQVMANHRECPGNRCHFAREGCCFYRRALYRAKRSHVVVVNHSLLLSGANIPFKSAVIDEAHTLEDVATEQFTEEFEYRDVRRFLESLHSPVDGGGFLADLAQALDARLTPGTLERARFEIGEAQEAVEICVEGLEKLFVALSDFYGGDESGTSDVRFGSGQVETVEYSRLQSRGEELASDLDRLEVRLLRALAAFADEAADDGELEYIAGDLEGKALRTAELESTLRVTLTGEPDDGVRWATAGHPDRFEWQALRASPIDVGWLLKEHLYDSLESAVLTSATLTVNGSFDFFASRVGLDLVEDRGVEAVVLDSSFDFRRQMQILTLHDMPEPTSAGYAARLAEVLSMVIPAAGGGVLVLFTNRKLMQDTYELVADGLRRQGLPVLCQLPGYSRRRLAEEFVEDPSASLFGTTSFWEGVDARGSTLRLVVVTRIPFESPGRPVFEARSERVKLEGGSDFMSLSLPLAALRLKQGVGRLIRTRSDRGQVLLLDSRITSMRYGQFLLRSLPEGRRRNVSLDEVARAVADFQSDER
jgi:predicted DnaQ family exonuclease/DinG family helicase